MGCTRKVGGQGLVLMSGIWYHLISMIVAKDRYRLITLPNKRDIGTFCICNMISTMYLTLTEQVYDICVYGTQ